MKNNPIFKNILNCNSDDEVFSYLVATLKETIKSWDYFVNWKKVIHNYREVERSLNLLNTMSISFLFKSLKSINQLSGFL